MSLEGLAFNCYVSEIVVFSLQPKIASGNEKSFGILLKSTENED